MKQHFSASVRSLSLLFGAAAALIVWITLALIGIPKALWWAIMIGAILTGIAAIVMMILVRQCDLRYKGVEQQIDEPIHMTVNANVTVQDVSRNGYLYLTTGKLICYFRDRTPYTKLAFIREYINSIRKLSPMCIEINDKEHSFEIICVHASELANRMRTLGWKVEEIDENS